MKQIGVIALLIAGGCQSTPEISPTGNGQFVVYAMNDACAGCEAAHVRAQKAADAYCERDGKVALVSYLEDKTYDLGAGHRVHLIFSCASK